MSRTWVILAGPSTDITVGGFEQRSRLVDSRLSIITPVLPLVRLDGPAAKQGPASVTRAGGPSVVIKFVAGRFFQGSVPKQTRGSELTASDLSFGRSGPIMTGAPDAPGRGVPVETGFSVFGRLAEPSLGSFKFGRATVPPIFSLTGHLTIVFGTIAPPPTSIRTFRVLVSSVPVELGPGRDALLVAAPPAPARLLSSAFEFISSSTFRSVAMSNPARTFCRLVSNLCSLIVLVSRGLKGGRNWRRGDGPVPLLLVPVTSGN